MRSLIIKSCTVLYSVILLSSCHNGEKTGDDEGQTAARTPVTVTTISNEPIADYIELNATSAFQQKSYVKANAGGYVQTVDVQLGKEVNKGQELFAIKTKEAQSIGNAINKLDPSLKFSGVNIIRAAARGYVTQLNHQAGDYVQDGEQLAVISNLNSFVFLLDLPYELRPFVANKKNVELILPDSTKLTGTIDMSMPSVDPATQTQRVVIRVPLNKPIPENLIAKVRIVKDEKTTASLPKAAILTNDIQSEFWVMKMTDSNTAVKVPIEKGIETKDRVEIKSPSFLPADKILVTGNYGLGDTALVKIVQ